MQAKQMSDETYRQRTKVMGIVRDAKQMAESEGATFPRIRVVICKDEPGINGAAKDRCIEVCESALTSPHFRNIVLQLIVLAIKPDVARQCPLMSHELPERPHSDVVLTACFTQKFKG